MKNFNLKEQLKAVTQGKCESIGLLALRLIVGSAFIIHGWGKIQSPFAWMPPGAPVPGFFQFLAAISEFGGGICLVLGLLTQLACLGIGFTMLVAVSMHAFVMHDPFVNLSGGTAFELPLTYLAVAFAVFMMGPGRFSLDSKLFGQRGHS